MSFTRAHNKAASGLNTSPMATGAFSGAATTGNFIVVAVIWQGTGASVSSISDGLGSSYTLVVTVTDGTSIAQIYIAKNITGGSTPNVSATMSGTFSNGGILAAEYHCSNGTGVVVRNSSTSEGGATGSGATDPTTGAVAGALSGDMGFAGTLAFGQVSGAGTGYTQIDNQTFWADEEKLSLAGGSTTASFVHVGSGAWLAVLAVIGPPPPTPPTTTPVFAGEYDVETTGAGWFDPDMASPGWFDWDLIQIPTQAGIKASFSDRGYGQQSQQAAHLYATTFIQASAVPNPPNPQAPFPDVGTARAFTPAAHLFSVPNIPDPAIFQPVPSGAFPDRGTGKPAPATAHELFSEWLAQTIPVAVFPGVGTGKPNARGAQQFIGQNVAGVGSFQPNPAAVYSDRGYGRPAPVGSHESASTFVPTTVVFYSPTPVFPERGYARSFLQLTVSESIVTTPTTSTANPSAIYPDAGNARPVPHAAHELYADFLATPPVVNPSGSWPDRGHAVPAPLAAHFFETPNIPDPATFQPSPSGAFPDRGTARPTQRAAFDPQPPYELLPAPPPPVYPDRPWESPKRPVGLAWVQPTFPPPAINPFAVYPDRGYGRGPAPASAHDPQGPFVLPPAPPPPVYSDRPWPTAPRQHAVGITHRLELALTPAAVYPDRPWPTAPRQHGGGASERISIPIPLPSAVYADRGYGRPVAPGAHFDPTPFLVIAPPPVVIPSAVYPSRGFVLDFFNQGWETSWDFPGEAYPGEALYATVVVSAAFGAQVVLVAAQSASASLATALAGTTTTSAALTGTITLR